MMLKTHTILIAAMTLPIATIPAATQAEPLESCAVRSEAQFQRLPYMHPIITYQLKDPEKLGASYRKPRIDYQTLAEQFAKGELPRPEDLEGWHSGRWFLKEDPRRAMAALMEGRTQDKYPRLAPITKDKKEKSNWFDGKPDCRNGGLLYRMVVGWLLFKKRGDCTSFSYQGRGVVFDEISTGNHHEVRRSGGNLILRLTKPTGEEIAYMYFSQDVTPAPCPPKPLENPPRPREFAGDPPCPPKPPANP